MVQFGIDVLLQTKKYKDLSIGLVCNEASLTSDGTHSRLALLQAGYHIKKLFAPEHGFSAKGDDGAFINDETDSVTQLPIVSLYSEKLAPNANDLADIDLVIVDLPDIGSRFYTYLWTMTYVMEACEEHKKELIILDRPNPIATHFEVVEGPILEENCSSFIGRFPIPIRHNCTLGELAQYFKHRYYPALKLEVIIMQKWDRYHQINYPFFGTSPAIQKQHTAYLYPGTCFFEGLNINEGRGTEFPFEQFGAPWLNAQLLKEKLLLLGMDASVAIVSFKAAASPYQGEICQGLRIIPRYPEKFKPVNYVANVIALIANLHPNKLKERHYLTRANPTGKGHLDKLVGVNNALSKIIKGHLDTAAVDWQNTMKPFLLYQ